MLQRSAAGPATAAASTLALARRVAVAAAAVALLCRLFRCLRHVVADKLPERLARHIR